jgi:hypothetical protein
MAQKRKFQAQSARPAQPSQSAPLAVIEQTSQRVRRQRLVNILSFFLPIGIATALVPYVLLTKFSLPLLFMLLPVGIWGGFFVAALRQTKILDEQEAAAALLDEKTLSKERFVTLATLSQPQSETALFPLLQRDTTKRAASFAPERDLPFQFDRRVPIGLLVSVLCLGGAFLIFSVPSQTLSKLIPALPASPASPSDIAERKLVALSQLEKKARKLAQDGKTPEEKIAGDELLKLAEKLKDPTLTPKEKEQLIDDAEERIQLHISIPQILPIDLKLFATKSENDDGDGNQGDQKQPNDKVLAKANEPSDQPDQLKKTPSASTDNEPQQGQKNDGKRKKGEQQDSKRKDGEQRDSEQQEDAQNKQPQPQEAGGGLKFDQPQQEGEKKKQPGQQQSGEQQQTASKQDPNQKTPGGDPNKPNERGDQQNQTPDPNKPGPNPNPDQPGKSGQGKGKSVGKGKAERFSKPGEKPGGFLTKDARYVKVRVPQGYEEQGQTTQRTTNTSQAQPKTPYSNAPLKHRPADKAKPGQLIPLEYRAILQN